MIPKDFIYKCMFVFLYDFTKGFKSLLFILLLYVFLLVYFSINDTYVIISFVIIYMILFIRGFDVNKTLNKEFKRYKKYLRLKRIRKHHGKDKRRV